MLYCACCSVEFEPQRDAQTFCSPKCYQRDYDQNRRDRTERREHSKAYYLRTKHAYRKRSPEVAEHYRVTMGAYARKWRAANPGRAAAHYLRNDYLRRAPVGMTADLIDPMIIFERDKWTCHVCLDVLDQSLRGTYNPKAPTVDHVIPVKVGGAHAVDNLKCACRLCNGRKRSKLLA